MRKDSIALNDKDRFELLWLHHHRQIDENRAVHNSLNELRKDIKRLENEIKSRAS